MRRNNRRRQRASFLLAVWVAAAVVLALSLPALPQRGGHNRADSLTGAGCVRLLAGCDAQTLGETPPPRQTLPAGAGFAFACLPLLPLIFFIAFRPRPFFCIGRRTPVLLHVRADE